MKQDPTLLLTQIISSLLAIAVIFKSESLFCAVGLCVSLTILAVLKFIEPERKAEMQALNKKILELSDKVESLILSKGFGR